MKPPSRSIDQGSQGGLGQVLSQLTAGKICLGSILPRFPCYPPLPPQYRDPGFSMSGYAGKMAPHNDRHKPWPWLIPTTAFQPVFSGTRNGLMIPLSEGGHWALVTHPMRNLARLGSIYKHYLPALSIRTRWELFFLLRQSQSQKIHTSFQTQTIRKNARILHPRRPHGRC